MENRLNSLLRLSKAPRAVAPRGLLEIWISRYTEAVKLVGSTARVSQIANRVFAYR